MKKRPVSNTRYLLENGMVTSKFRSKLAEVLGHYVDIASLVADKRQKHLEDYRIREAHVVGSVLRGIDDSDLDLLLIADKIDQTDYRIVKTVLSELFFNNIPKQLAVDVFVRPYDEFPDRGSFEVTSEVREILKDYNDRLILHREPPIGSG